MSKGADNKTSNRGNTCRSYKTDDAASVSPGKQIGITK